MLNAIRLGSPKNIVETPENIIQLLQKVLPDQSNYIVQHQQGSFPYIFEFIEDEILKLLRAAIGSNAAGDIADLREIQDVIQKEAPVILKGYANTAPPLRA